MKKTFFKALEKVFCAEIENRLPFQSKAKIFPELCDEGLLLPMETIYGSGPLAVKVSGFQLSHVGRYMYCNECKNLPELEF